MSQAGKFSANITPGTYIQQIDGDTGSATGAIITFTANPSAGSTISFDAAGSTVTFNVTDGNQNTIMGSGAGNGSISGTGNAGFGSLTLAALTSGDENAAFGMGALNELQSGTGNTSIGQSSLAFLTTGDSNTVLGSSSGLGYTGAESFNIIIGGSINGTLGESNVLRIGANTGAGLGKINKAFIHGMRGIVEATADGVLINSSTGQIISIAAGTTGQILTSQGAGANPTWTTPSTSAASYTSINTASSPYTVLATDYYISADATAGPITVRLPNAPATGRVFVIKDKAGITATNNITITTVGGVVTIDGSTSFVMNTAYESVSVIFGGTNYEVW